MMKLPKPSRKLMFVVVALALICARLAGPNLWRVFAFKEDEKLSQGGSQVDLRTSMRRGVGSEVNFASAGATTADVGSSVDSVDKFISSRSNFKMSDETKKSLAQAEHDVLNGASKRISLEELTEAFTDTVTERLAALTDQEIEQTANFFAAPEGEITPRARGSWGLATAEELTKQLQQVRDESISKNSMLRAELQAQITNKLNERVAILSETAPEKFGSVANEGVTPLQAVLLGYSIVANDPLAGSQSDLAQQLIQQRITDRRTRGKEPQRLARAYGIYGELQALPVQLVFNKAGIAGLLARLEGGEKR